VIVTVDVEALPTFAVSDVGEADMLKSGAEPTMYVTPVECDNEPLVPVTVTVYVPAAVPVHARLLVWDVPRLTLFGVRLQDSPVDGEIVDERVTAPVNPLTEATVIVEVPDELMVTEIDVGFADTVKSGAALTP